MATYTTSHFDIDGQTDKGRLRLDNQDDLLLADTWFAGTRIGAAAGKAARNRRGRLYIVADGVGGHADGALASHLTVTTVMRCYYTDPDTSVAPAERLRHAIERANERIAVEAARAGSNMASTVVAALIHDRMITIANVGDSSAWLFRPGRPPEKLTVDHIQRDSDGNPGLTQAIGDPQVRAALRTVRFDPDDAVVLCTDGLTDLLGPEEIGRVVRDRSARNATRALIRLANSRGGHDNITALVVRHGVVPALVRKKVWRLLLAGAVGLAFAAAMVWLAPGQPAPMANQPRPSQTALRQTPAADMGAAFAGATADQLFPTSSLVEPTQSPVPPDTPTPAPAPQPRPVAAQPSARPPTATRVAQPSPTIPVEPSPLADRAFLAVVDKDFRGTGQSGQQQSCLAGQVFDRAGQGVAGAVLSANNGSVATPDTQTDDRGAFRICGLGDSVWSIVLWYVPGELPLRAHVLATVYMNGSGEQVATVTFREQ